MMNKKVKLVLTICRSFAQIMLMGEDGYRLWLRYDLITDTRQLSAYRQTVQAWTVMGGTPTMQGYLVFVY